MDKDARITLETMESNLKLQKEIMASMSSIMDKMLTASENFAEAERNRVTCLEVNKNIFKNI